jgi:hypothetical protein
MLFANRIRPNLRDETGSTLVDSMVGVFVLAITVGALVFAVTNISNATSKLADRAGQEMAMRSVLGSLSNFPAGVSTTPSTSEFDASARTLSVTQVRIDLGGGRSLIRAITGKKSSEDCSDVDAVNPSPADYDRCLIYEQEVTTSSSPASTAGVTAAMMSA